MNNRKKLICVGETEMTEIKKEKKSVTKRLINYNWKNDFSGKNKSESLNGDLR